MYLIDKLLLLKIFIVNNHSLSPVTVKKGNANCSVRVSPPSSFCHMYMYIEKKTLIHNKHFRCDIQLTEFFKDFVFRRVTIFVELGLLRFQFRAEYRLFSVLLYLNKGESVCK